MRIRRFPARSPVAPASPTLGSRRAQIRWRAQARSRNHHCRDSWRTAIRSLPRTPSAPRCRGRGDKALRNKVVGLAEAIAIIRDGDTLATSGFVGIGTPDELLVALEQRFLETGAPRDLTLLFAAGQGDGKERGLNRLGARRAAQARGRRSLGPGAARSAGWRSTNRIEAYNLPQGVISHLYRDIAASEPGIVHQGRPAHLRRSAPARAARSTTSPREDLVRADRDRRRGVAVLQGLPDPRRLHPRHHRRPRRQHHHGARGADARQSGDGDGGARTPAGWSSPRSSAMRRGAARSTRARSQIPGIMVDCVVVAEPAAPPQTYATVYTPAFSGEIARAAGRAAADAARRAQDDRPALRLRAAGWAASSISASACPRAWPRSPTRRRSSPTSP